MSKKVRSAKKHSISVTIFGSAIVVFFIFVVIGGSCAVFRSITYAEKLSF